MSDVIAANAGRLDAAARETLTDAIRPAADAGDPIDATHLGEMPRDVDLQSVTFYGEYLTTDNGIGYVPDGNYQLQLKVLKPLGNASSSKHWETYTSPKFFIEQ